MQWKSILALGLTASTVQLSASAQLPPPQFDQAQPVLPTAQPAAPAFNLGSSVQLQQGTVIPVSTSGGTNPQYFYPDTVYSVVLAVSEPIYNANSQLMLPAGSKVYGQLVPSGGGSRLVATSLLINGRTYSIRAQSEILPDEKDPRHYTTGSVAEDATVGLAGGVILGMVTGGVTTAGLLGGAVAGVTTGNITAPQVVVLRPGQSFPLTFQAPFQAPFPVQ